MLVIELGLEGNIPSIFCGDGTNCCTYGGSSQNFIFVLLLIVELETLAPSWGIFDVLAHLTFAPTWEKWVVSDQI
jgi:hypothetical protein